MNKKIYMSRRTACFVLSTCLLITLTGCSSNELFKPEAVLPVSEPVEALNNEDHPVEHEDTVEFVGFSEEYLNKEYGSFAEAYLDILTGNRLVLTDGLISDHQKRSGLHVGEGKIAVIDVFGDKTPELLCLYYTDPEKGLYLRIFSYSETKGVESVFDNVIYQAIGGEHAYCVYITRDGELILFLWSSGVTSIGGFWPIIPNQNLKYNPHPLDGFVYSRDLALLGYVVGAPVDFYIQHGDEISKDRFNKVSSEIMGNIDGVLFQGPVLSELELGLYKNVELWRDITPFKEISMTYDEAVAWLKAQS